MKFNADVIHETVRPADDDRINYVGVEAENEHAAVRLIADAAAMRRYGKEDEDGDWVMGDAMSTHIEMIRSTKPLDKNVTVFRAFIGTFDGKGRTTGVSIKIRLFPTPADERD